MLLPHGQVLIAMDRSPATNGSYVRWQTRNGRGHFVAVRVTGDGVVVMDGPCAVSLPNVDALPHIQEAAWFRLAALDAEVPPVVALPTATLQLIGDAWARAMRRRASPREASPRNGGESAASGYQMLSDDQIKRIRTNRDAALARRQVS